MGGSKVRFPEQSPQERELQGYQLQALKEQGALTREQLRQQDLLLPHLYKSAGLKPMFSEGKISGFEAIPQAPEPVDPLAGMRQDIERQLLQRSQAALAGNLPVDPALERGLGEQRQLLQDTLAQQLGPGYQTSTPGQQALATQAQRAEELRSGARTAQLSLAEQLGLQRQEMGLQRERTTLAQALGAGELAQGRFGRVGGAFGAPGTTGAGTSNYLQSLSQALGLGQQERGMLFGARQFNASQPGFMDFLGQLLLTGVGGASAGAGAAFGRKLF